MRGTRLLVAACLLLTGGRAFAASPPPDLRSTSDPAPNLDGIHAADLMQTVEWLASPELKGRLAGSPEFMQAARGAADRFRRWGLRPGGDAVLGNSASAGAARGDASRAGAPNDAAPTDASLPDAWFQDLAIEYNPIAECALALVRADGTRRDLELGRDYACRGLTGSATVTAPVVFVGYGLSLPEKGYDDYAGVDVRGRVALAFKEAPPFEADSTGWGGIWMPRPKGAVAAAHGAAALLLVSRPNQEHPQRPIGSMLEGEAEHDAGFLRLQIATGIGEEMAQSAGVSLAALQSRIDSTRAPFSRALNVSAQIGVRATYEPRRRSVNVVALVVGSDPVLKDQLVVVGAHLDHVGSQGKLYYPGANDNASGSAVVLALAEAFARNPVRPRRSVAFGLWSSEEAGLFGARRFVERPPVPRERIVAYLNFDCVGHGDSIEVGGGESYPGFWEAAREIDRRNARLMVEHTGRGGGADADPFEEAGIPNLYFASRFSYTHLHQPSDTPGTLNPALLEAVARLGYATAWKIAQAEVEAKRE
jgi:hypothetical protein